MELKHMSLVDFQKNSSQAVQTVNEHQPLLIQGPTKSQSAVLLSEHDYQRLQKGMMRFESTAKDMFYQKLSLLDDVKNDNTFFSIGESAIMASFRQITPINLPIMYQQSNELIGCISAYALRANGQLLTAVNLKQLSKRPIDELMRVANQMRPDNALYHDVITDCWNQLQKLAPNDEAKRHFMESYRLLLV